MAAWVYPSNGSSRTVMGNWGNPYIGVMISTSSSQVNFFVDNSTTLGAYGYTPTGLNNNEWAYLVLVFDGSGSTNSDKLKGYINGVEQTLTYTGTIESTTATPNRSFRIGDAHVGNGLVGDISNAAIWDQAISAEDIKYLYNGGTPQTSLSFEPVSWWKLDNLTTGIQDSGSASNNGTNNGATAVSSSVAVDQWNFDNVSQAQTPNWSSALDFSGSNQWIDCGIDSSIDTGDLSVAFWFNKDSSASGYQYVFNSGSGSAVAGFVFAFQGTNIYVGRKTITHDAGFGGFTNIGISAGISADKWHHIALTYNDTSYNFVVYLDGQPVHTSTGSSVPPNAVSREIIFGRISNVASSYYKGKISNAAIFTSELDAAAISTLYNNGQPEAAISSSPLSWWKLDNTASGIQDSGSASNDGTNNGATETQTNVWTPRLNGEKYNITKYSFSK